MYDGSKIPWENISAATNDKGFADNAKDLRKRAWMHSKAKLDRGPSSDVRLFKQWISSDMDAGGPGDMFASCTVLRRLAHDMGEVPAKFYLILLR
eukprot:15796-Hanusia_phi.AAC.2